MAKQKHIGKNRYDAVELLRVCNSIAPTPKIVQAFDQLYAESIDYYPAKMPDQDAYQYAQLRLTQALLDGLSYGNWPGLRHGNSEASP